MAKKTVNKTIEELLKEALIPKPQQPYKIPDNWVWVKVKSINFKQNKVINPNANEIYELYSIPSYMDNYPEIIDGEKIKSSKLLVKKNDILLSKINPKINRVWKVNKYTDFKLIASSEWIIIDTNNKFSEDFLLYNFKAEYFRNILNNNVSGVGGSLTRVRPKEVLEYPILFPPIDEQKRIVEKLESMLEKLNQARELINEAKETFELRRASILHKAFTGELTENWRKENKTEKAEKLLEKINEEKIQKWKEESIEAEKEGKKKPRKPEIKSINEMKIPESEYPFEIPENWEYINLENITTKIQYGYTASSQETGKIKYLRITDIQNNNVFWEKVPFCEIDENKFQKFCLKKNDIVVARTGATTGKSYLIKDLENAVFASYLIRISLFYIKPKYLWYFMQSKDYWRQITENISGIAQPGVNASKLSKLKIILPPIEEQKEIVRQLEILLKAEEEAKDLLDLEDQIDILEKTILSKAFRGELGTNDPNDEPAIELLKKILSEKN